MLISEVLELGHLKVVIREQEGRARYTLAGDVDEAISQESFPATDLNEVILDLSGIMSFNSCGLREWIRWIQIFSSHHKVYFENCSVPTIDQMNMMPQTMGKGTVLSFYAPYYCETCGEVNQLVLMDRYAEMLRQKKAPDFSCETCGDVLCFDALAASYFLFADSRAG